MKKIVYCTFGLFLMSCENEVQPPKSIWNTEKSTALNRELSIEEDLDIRLYFSQHPNLKVVETGTGLRYVVVKSTEGEMAVAGKNAKVEYKISLLDGTVCYQTPKGELDVFEVDKSDIESGIHEGIKHMHVGERLKLVFPSHLAHGLVGDMDKIPPLSPLVVDIELIEIE